MSDNSPMSKWTSRVLFRLRRLRRLPGELNQCHNIRTGTLPGPLFIVALVPLKGLCLYVQNEHVCLFPPDKSPHFPAILCIRPST